MLRFRFIIFLLLVVLNSSCQERNLRVRRICPPDYPSPARYKGLQGTVVVEVSIGADGQVISAMGSGAHRILVEAAEENARQWVFGPFPAVAEFPLSHKITYVYKLEGNPLVVAVPPRIKTFLPDRIEIIATPLRSDYPPPESYKPLPPNQR